MKTTLRSFMLVLFSVIYSCEKDNQPTINENKGLSITPPETPEAVYYDINNDSINDFTIDYWGGILEGITTYDIITGGITLLEDNKLLDPPGIGIFLSENDTVFLTERESLNWYSFKAALVSISSTPYPHNYWPKEWSIIGDTTQEFHYAVININEDNDFIVGWIKMKISKMTGGIEIVDKNLSNNNYIVIGK